MLLVFLPASQLQPVLDRKRDPTSANTEYPPEGFWFITLGLLRALAYTIVAFPYGRDDNCLMTSTEFSRQQCSLGYYPYQR